MSEKTSLIIIGHGFPDCVLGAALVALREQLEGRFPEFRQVAKEKLAETLEEVALNPPDYVYLVGIGLGGQPERMEAPLDELKAHGSRVTWLSAIPMSARIAKSLGGRLEECVDIDRTLPQLAYHNFGPWGIDEATAHGLMTALNADDELHGIAMLIYQTMGFVNRVMEEPHKSHVLKLGIKALLKGKKVKIDGPLAAYEAAYHSYGHREIKGKSAPIEQMKALLRKVAPVDGVRVMILGESGTGKESVATHIHLNSLRWNKTMLSFNCASANPGLLEATFQGSKKGSYTGSTGDKKGLFELANGGTLFLDEIGDLPLEIQGVLLRILEEKCVLPLGADKEVPVDVRLITATNKDLWKMAQEGKFRLDLIYRLQEFTIRTSPLREVKEDLYPIANAIWRSRMTSELPVDAREPLKAYDWPGNVRELGNFLKFAEVMGGNDWQELLNQYLLTRGGAEYAEAKPEPEMPVELSKAVKWHCRRIYEKSGCNLTQAAKKLGIERNTLRKHLGGETE